MTTIAVIDHGAGNLVSIAQALERTGARVVVADAPRGIEGADGVVLPGVGATRAVMNGISSAGFTDAVANWEGPLLGICVGMQVLFDSSAEDGAECFGLIGGKVQPLADAPRLPHIGWNDVAIADDPLFAGLDDQPTFYFVHGYAPEPVDPDVAIGTTVYGRPFVSAVRSGPRVGTQFHPERSDANGLQVLANFVKGCT